MPIKNLLGVLKCSEKTAYNYVKWAKRLHNF